MAGGAGGGGGGGGGGGNAVSQTSFFVTDDVSTVGVAGPPTNIASGGFTNDSTLLLSGTAIAGGAGATINIWVGFNGATPVLLNPTPIAVADLGGTWSYNAPAETQDGSYSYYVTDARQTTWPGVGSNKLLPLNGVTTQYDVILDTTPPLTPVITSVLDDLLPYTGVVDPGTTTNDHTLTLVGLSDGSSTVEIWDGVTKLGTAFADPSTGDWQFTTASLGLGVHDFKVFAIDEAGNPGTGFSSTYSVTIEDGAVCFLKGTRVRTPAGEVAVEELKIGDLVSTSSGGTQAVRWIGRRSYVTRFLAGHNRRNVLPVRIARGALADNVPQRDLFVSPEHALCLEGALIPARHLVNGRSIAYCESLETIEYFHIELPRHDVLIAEGAAAESWLDCGNRNFFMNVVDYLALGLPDQPPAKACLPFIKEGPVLQELRARLLARASAVGYETTTDADVHLIVDGERINAARSDGKVHHFSLDRAPETLVLGSRSVTPAEIDSATKDSRQLGVSFTHLVLRAGSTEIRIGHDHPLLADGFQADEPRHRWTNGTGVIPPQFLACLTGPVQVEVHVASLAAKYPRPFEAPAAIAVANGEREGGTGHLRLAA